MLCRHYIKWPDYCEFCADNDYYRSQLCQCKDCQLGLKIYTHFTYDQAILYSEIKHIRRNLNDECLRLIYTGQNVPQELTDQFDMSFYFLNTVIAMGRL